MRQFERAFDRRRFVLFGRNRNRQNNADGARGGNQQSGCHAVAEPRTGRSTRPSFTWQDLLQRCAIQAAEVRLCREANPAPALPCGASGGS